MSQDKFTVPKNPSQRTKQPQDVVPNQSSSSPSSSSSSSSSPSSSSPSRTPIQRQRGYGEGIQTVHINAAREMYAATVRARGPSSSSASSSRSLASSESSSSSITANPNYIPNASNIIKRTPMDLGAIEPPMENSGMSVISNNMMTNSISPKISVPAKNHNKLECTNPQCSHCGRVIIPSPVASFPLVETPSISVNDWEIYTTKKPILNSDEIDLEQDRLGIPIPEMIFGHNKMEIKNKIKNFAISFNTPDALSLVDTTGENLLQVSYSKEWFSTRNTNTEDVKGIVKPFDWTYSTPYRGSLIEGNILKESLDVKIPLDRLKKPDPILFFDDMVLYEDELGDNGISVLSCKIRVMPERLLLLSRFFLRVDNVIFRIRDTRVYIEFNENLIIREYKEQEANYQDVMKKISPLAGDPRAFLRDQNWIASKLPVVKTIIDYATL